jgi:hypothetical protein
MEKLMAAVRVRQGAKVLGTPILTLSYDHTPDQFFSSVEPASKTKKDGDSFKGLWNGI